MKCLILSCLLFVLPQFAYSKVNKGSKKMELLNSIKIDQPSIDNSGWGFELGIGQQAYRSKLSRLSLVTPYLFTKSRVSGARLTFDYEFSDVFNTTESLSVSSTALNIEMSGKVLHDLIYSYFRLGVKINNFDDRVYTSNLISYPFTIGVQIITAVRKNAVASFFVEFKQPITSDFSFSQSTNSYLENSLISNALYAGLRVTY